MQVLARPRILLLAIVIVAATLRTVPVTAQQVDATTIPTASATPTTPPATSTLPPTATLSPTASPTLTATTTTTATQTGTPAATQTPYVIVQSPTPLRPTQTPYIITATVAATAIPSLTPSRAPVTATIIPLLGDGFENNYRPADAPLLGWGQAADLSLRCPVVDGCVRGDHDMFRVPVKSGEALVALTYDLAPGVDTTLALYRPLPGFIDPATGIDGWQLARGSDDLQPGVSLRSQVGYTPDWDGEALVIIAASARRDPAAPGTYRLLIGPPALPAVATVLAAQRDPATPTAQAVSPTAVVSAPPAATIPPPTAVPTRSAGTESSSGSRGDGSSDGESRSDSDTTDPEDIIKEHCATGLATVRNADAPFAIAAPPSPERIISRYPLGARIRLLGSCYVGWVKVLPDGNPSPGWMFAPDLQVIAVTGTGGTPTATRTTDAVPGDASSSGGSGSTRADGSGVATNVPLAAPASLPRLTLATATARPAPTALPRQPRTVSVLVRDRDNQPLAQIRVQLADAFGTLLSEGMTDATGRIALPSDRPAGDALVIRVPAAGLSTTVRGDGQLALTLPGRATGAQP